MDARGLEATERIPASRKLQAKDARAILKESSKLIVAKGKKISEFDVSKKVSAEAVQAMLGPTGNLRAPTLRVGKTVFVGFNEDAMAEFFDG
jgi:arsenate reductase-like glutaredoxin family protein